MNFEMITEGLKQLLQENNYSSATIRFYEGEWNKIQCFLTEEYGNTEYDMERGLKYLEKQYGFITKYNNGTLSQQRVQESVIFSMQTFTVKLASGVAVFLAGLVVDWIHLDTAAAVQTQDTLDVLRMWMTIPSVILLIVGIFVFKRFYKLDDTRMEEIKSKLN